MKRYSKELIKYYAKGVYAVLMSTHGLVNSKKIVVEINKLIKGESKRRKELE